MTIQDEIVTELLPCPFCGEADAFSERADFSSSYVVCNNCLVRGPTCCQDSDDEDEPGKDAAIAAWNTRSTAQERALDDDAELIEAGQNLADAVLAYCLKHDTLGGGHTNTGRAWDLMKRREREWTAKARLQAKAPETGE